MVTIQIILLFTSINKFSPDQRQQLRDIVREEYAAVFNRGEDEVETALFDAFSETNKQDLILAINTDRHVMNEAVLWGKLKKQVADRMSLMPQMTKLGFTGYIGIQDGEVKDSKAQESPRDPQNSRNSKSAAPDNMDYRTRAKQYQATEPKYNFDRLIIPEETLDQIEKALGRILYEREVFEEWGLYEIMPSPVSALSFYGDPGTGKSMAADAIAQKLGKKIIRASYADIENKYVGEGPKNVSAIFLAAEEQDAVLFIDEADSLLSKRMVNVSDPSGQAMNSMRSQLLICLEKFHGIVIFATNLAINYDRAFVSRLINIEFRLPDASLREKIWHAHLYPTEQSKQKPIHLNIPLAPDVDLKAIAEAYPLCGRDIRNAVVEACVAARMKDMPMVDMACLTDAAKMVVARNQGMANAADHTVLQPKGPREVDAPAHIKQALADSINRRLEKEKNEAQS